MADKYISAEAFKRRIQAEMDKEKAWQPMDTAYHIFLDMIYDLIEMSVDEMSADYVVEVVRCKDCIYLRESDPLHPDTEWCQRLICGTIHPEFFCADGRRKENTDAEIH